MKIITQKAAIALTTHPDEWVEPSHKGLDILSVPLFCSPNVLLARGSFGFVSALPETVGSTTVVTAAGALSLAWSRGYIAPEVADGKHGAANDIYNYGVVRRWSIVALARNYRWQM